MQEETSNDQEENLLRDFQDYSQPFNNQTKKKIFQTFKEMFKEGDISSVDTRKNFEKFKEWFGLNNEDFEDEEGITFQDNIRQAAYLNSGGEIFSEEAESSRASSDNLMGYFAKDLENVMMNKFQEESEELELDWEEMKLAGVHPIFIGTTLYYQIL